MVNTSAKPGVQSGVVELHLCEASNSWRQLDDRESLGMSKKRRSNRSGTRVVPIIYFIFLY